MASNTTTAVYNTQPRIVSQPQYHGNIAQAQTSSAQELDDGSMRFPPVDTSKPYLKLLMAEPYPEANNWRLHARQCRKALRIFSVGQSNKDWKSVPVFEDDASDEDESDDRDGEKGLASKIPGLVDCSSDSESDEAPSPKRKLSITATVRCDSPAKKQAHAFAGWLDPPPFYDWSKFETTKEVGSCDLQCSDQSLE